MILKSLSKRSSVRWNSDRKDAVIMYSLSKELSDRVFDHEIFHNKALARQFASRAGELATQAIELAPNDAKAYTALALRTHA